MSFEANPEKCEGSEFLRRILHEPSYGYERDGRPYFPKASEIFREIASAANIFKTRKNWISFYDVIIHLFMLGVAIIYFSTAFTLKSFACGCLVVFLFDFCVGDAFYHRGLTHRAYKIRNKFALVILNTIAPVDLPEESFVLSHTVHHALSDRPGDPYNSNGGFLYCYFTELIHHNVSRALSRKDYDRVCKILRPGMLYQNSYRQYLKWGTVANPWVFFAKSLINWIIRGVIVVSIFDLRTGYAYISAILLVELFYYRTINYVMHGRGGKTKSRDGVEFYQGDLSVNDLVTPIILGQRHNYHHLYPRSANTGFLKGQIDIAYVWVRIFERLRLVSDVVDSTEDFMRDHWRPYHQGAGSGGSLSEASS